MLHFIADHDGNATCAPSQISNTLEIYWFWFYHILWCSINFIGQRRSDIEYVMGWCIAYTYDISNLLCWLATYFLEISEVSFDALINDMQYKTTFSGLIPLEHRLKWVFSFCLPINMYESHGQCDLHEFPSDTHSFLSIGAISRTQIALNFLWTEEKITRYIRACHAAIGEHICAMYQITVIRYNQYAADKKKNFIVIALE